MKSTRFLTDLDSDEVRRVFVQPDDLDRANYIVVTYQIVAGQDLNLEQAAARLAIIMSLRTLVPISVDSSPNRLDHGALVLSLHKHDKYKGQLTLAFPVSLCSHNDGLNQVLNVVLSGVEYSYSDQFWLEQIEFPKCIQDRYVGPRHGVAGIRQLIKVSKRPLLGVVVLPYFGMKFSKLIDLCYASLVGGADYITDDVLLVDPEGDFSFRKRVSALTEVTRRAREKTGEPKWYVANIGSSPRRSLRNALFAQKEGVNALKTNAFSMGFSSLEELTSHPRIHLPVITSNMGVGLLTRPSRPRSPGPSTGVSEEFVARLSRIGGADGVHLGSVAGGCFAQAQWHPAIRALQSSPSRFKKSWIVIDDDDITVANAWRNIHAFGQDTMIDVGHGILGYPGGADKAASAFRRLLETLPGSLTQEDAKDGHFELMEQDANCRAVFEYYHLEEDLANTENLD